MPTASKPRRGCTSASRPGTSSSRRRRSSPASSRATSDRARTSIPEAATRRRNYALQRMADEGFITQAQASTAKGAPDQDGGPADAAVLAGAVLRRGSASATRGAVRRQAAVRERPVGADDPGPAAAAGGDPSAAGGPAPARPAAGLPQADQPARLRRGPRRVPASALAGADERRRRRSRCRDGHDGHRDPGTGRAARRAHSQGRIPVDRQGDGQRAGGTRCARAGADRATRGRRPHGRGPPRPGTGTAGRRRRARQPHRAHPHDGGRVRLRPQQVQPRHPGVTAARIDVQAGGLHRGDRSRLHAGEHAARCAGVVPGRRRIPAVRAAQLRPSVPRDRSRCVAPWSSRATCRPSD